MSEQPTPRTDKEALWLSYTGAEALQRCEKFPVQVVKADFARELERELATVKEENIQLLRQVATRQFEQLKKEHLENAELKNQLQSVTSQRNSLEERYSERLLEIDALRKHIQIGRTWNSPDSLLAELAEIQKDKARLDWLMHNISGRALRSINVITSAGCTRASVDAAMSEYHSCREHAVSEGETSDCECERYRCSVCGKRWKEELPQ